MSTTTAAEMVAEIELLRAARADADLTPLERRRRERRVLTIPLFAAGMVSSEVAAAIGAAIGATEGVVHAWGARDPEIRWWCQAAYAARREVWTLTPSERAARQAARNRRNRAERFAATAANGGIAPDQPHGAPSTYTNWNCRCEPCRAAHSVAMKARPSRPRASR